MKRYFFFSLTLILIMNMVSCKKTEGFHSLTDFQAPVGIMVSNIYDYLPTATVKASKVENKISITIQIPSGSGRTIKEITKIAASTTANFTAIYSGTAVGTGTSQLWSNTPIPVNATSYTFNTTFDEYKLKTATATNPASNALLARDFYFQVTLDNGESLISENIRVWVVD